jgi:hypothetical protein
MSILAQKSSITFWPQPVVPSHVSWLCSKSAWVGVGLLSQSDSIESPGVAHLSIFFFLKHPTKFLSLGPENLISVDYAKWPRIRKTLMEKLIKISKEVLPALH